MADATLKHGDVQNPDHYAVYDIEPIEFIMANDIPYCEANVIKYVCRWRMKGGTRDLLKAREYIDKLIAWEAEDGGPESVPNEPLPSTPVRCTNRYLIATVDFICGQDGIEAAGYRAPSNESL